MNLREYLGHAALQYLGALGIFLGALAGLYGLRKLLCSQLRAFALRSRTDLDTMAVHLLRRIRPHEFVLISLYLATRSLDLNRSVDKVIHLVFLVAISYRAVASLQTLLFYYMRKSAGASEAEGQSAMQLFRLLLSILMWTAGVAFVMDNLGINISAVVAGLGIGGVAVALATQQVLGDIFSSFVLFLDKPFKIGDSVSLNGHSGTVEYIGIKTTRLRAAGGELLIVPNKDLTAAPIRNFQQMKRRRAALSFTLDFKTPPALLPEVPGMVREAVRAQELADFERAHLAGFGEGGVLFEAVYFVRSKDMGPFMDVQQAVALGLLERFRKEGIALSQPSMSVQLQKGASP
jgi:small-conductance mechanosensitive channel